MNIVHTFEHGLLLKFSTFDRIITLPEILYEFNNVFDLLNIDYRVILTDMFDGSEFIKRVFEHSYILKSYNPLKNLLWDDKNKKWMNHKLFTKEFEPISPSL